MPPRLRGGAWGHPGNVQARGLNPAQPSDQIYAAGFVKVPRWHVYLDHRKSKKVSRSYQGQAQSCRYARLSNLSPSPCFTAKVTRELAWDHPVRTRRSSPGLRLMGTSGAPSVWMVMLASSAPPLDTSTPTNTRGAGNENERCSAFGSAGIRLKVPNLPPGVPIFHSCCTQSITPEGYAPASSVPAAR